MGATLPSFASVEADSPKVSLVIGSGGVRCAAALGVVKALADAGIGIERVVGCSAGAIFAALVAYGYPMVESGALAMRLWPRELAARRSAFGLLRAAAQRLPGRRVAAARFGVETPQLGQLAAAFGDRRIESAALPLHLAATDFETGELVELADGPLVEAMHAGLSLPPADPPRRVDGRLLADGYLADPLPVSLAIRHGARVIVAVGFEHPYLERAGDAARAPLQLKAILANNLLRARLAFHSAAHHAEMIIIIPEFKLRPGRFETDRLAAIIDEGEQAALQQLPYLHHLLAGERVQAEV